jgi:hypothetical protein
MDTLPLLHRPNLEQYAKRAHLVAVSPGGGGAVLARYSARLNG